MQNVRSLRGITIVLTTKQGSTIYPADEFSDESNTVRSAVRGVLDFAVKTSMETEVKMRVEFKNKSTKTYTLNIKNNKLVNYKKEK